MGDTMKRYIVSNVQAILRKPSEKIIAIGKWGNSYIVFASDDAKKEIENIFVGNIKITKLSDTKELMDNIEYIYKDGKFLDDNPTFDDKYETQNNTLSIPVKIIKTNEGITYIPTKIQYDDTGANIVHMRKEYNIIEPVILIPFNVKDVYRLGNDIIFDIEFDFGTEKIPINGTIKEILDKIKHLPVYTNDKELDFVLRTLLSYVTRMKKIGVAYSVIGVTIDNNQFVVTYPQTTKILPKSDQQRTILSRIKRYNIEPTIELIETYIKYIKNHEWGLYSLMLLGYSVISPIIYQIPEIEVRPDVVIIGKHGTAKTRTSEIIVGTLYGSIMESGEFITSVSRMADLLTSTTIPVIIDEIEKIGDKDTFSVLKSRTTGEIDFVRKTPDQRQIRMRYTTPAILISNRADVLSDENYIKGRTLLIDTGLFNQRIKMKKKPPKEYTKLRKNNTIIGVDLWNYIASQYTPENIVDTIYDRVHKIYKYNIDLIDIRRPQIYALVSLGLELFNEYLKYKGINKKLYNKKITKDIIKYEEKTIIDVYETLNNHIATY